MSEFDVIVVGSGMGGMTTAAALSWLEHKVLLSRRTSRMLSDALAASTPVPGLFLTGQDVMSPGIAGALAGGMLGAAAIDPRVYRKFVW
ncbi:MAG: FAD-binding protein [Myxococcales bacterium]|nr:FAD-binding protein [Myxococcales bacterium]MDH3844101.1 FAD-binding protein [Myxococcales bacterium]